MRHPLRHRASTFSGFRAHNPETRRIRLRSSTNAEDLAGLTGAGLYTSHSACLADVDEDAPGGSQCLTELEKARTEALIAKLAGATARFEHRDEEVGDIAVGNVEDALFFAFLKST